jgi:hypothetical protein
MPLPSAATKHRRFTSSRRILRQILSPVWSALNAKPWTDFAKARQGVSHRKQPGDQRRRLLRAISAHVCTTCGLLPGCFQLRCRLGDWRPPSAAVGLDDGLRHYYPPLTVAAANGAPWAPPDQLGLVATGPKLSPCPGLAGSSSGCGAASPCVGSALWREPNTWRPTNAFFVPSADAH